MPDKSPEEKDGFAELFKKLWLPVAGFLGAIKLSYDFYKMWTTDRNTVASLLTVSIYLVIIIALGWVGFGKKNILQPTTKKGEIPVTKTQPRFSLPYRVAAWCVLALLLFFGIQVYGVVCFNTGYNYYSQGDYSNAISNFDTAIRINPQDAQNYYFRGLSYSGLNDLEHSIQDYDQALQINPQYADAYFYRGIDYHNSGDLQKAIENYNSAIQINPQYKEAYADLGLAYFALNDYQSAIQYYNQALQIDSQYKEGYLYRALAYASLKDYKQAIKDYDQAIQVDPKYVDAYFNRGNAYNELGEYDYAIKDFEITISFTPDDSNLLNNTAYLMALHDSDLQKALEYVNKAIELQPDNSNFLDTQGIVYYKTGEYEKALIIFNYVINEKQLSYSYYGRGLTYEALGDRNKAISDLKAFLAEYPNDTLSEDAIKHLKTLDGTP